MSFGTNYWLLTSLPLLAEPGAAPPLSPAELRARSTESDAAPLVDVVLLADDLHQRQARLAGELAEVEPAVLAPDQITGWAPLPPSLGLRERTGAPRPSDDEVWEAYWSHAARVARRRRSTFVASWVAVEVALRNALAAARARALHLARGPRPVAPHLAGTDRMVERAVAAWIRGIDPLTAWRALTRARWEWATSEEARFSFSRDEVAAYAVKLLLLRDWRRTMGAAVAAGTTGATGAAA